MIGTFMLGLEDYLMTWFSDKVMLTKAVLFRDMLSPKNNPIVTRPFHCRFRVSLCLKSSIVLRGICPHDALL